MMAASLDQSAMARGVLKEEKLDSVVRPSPIIKQGNTPNSTVGPKEKDIKEEDIMLTFAPKEKDVKELGYGASDNVVHDEKRVKLQQENCNTTLEKLKRFFDIVQKQHPESLLELQHVEGGWKVWCGACKKLLRPDKSGKAIHNIQRQHFSSSRHKKKLHLLLQAEGAVAEGHKTHATERGDAMRKGEYTAEKN